MHLRYHTLISLTMLPTMTKNSFSLFWTSAKHLILFLTRPSQQHSSITICQKMTKGWSWVFIMTAKHWCSLFLGQLNLSRWSMESIKMTLCLQFFSSCPSTLLEAQPTTWLQSEQLSCNHQSCFWWWPEPDQRSWIANAKPDWCSSTILWLQWLEAQGNKVQDTCTNYKPSSEIQNTVKEGKDSSVVRTEYSQCSSMVQFPSQSDDFSPAPSLVKFH